MASRVGIDLISVERVRESISAHEGRYLERVYTDRELTDCATEAGFDPERLAARFAAKEATMKVLRPGDEGVPWASIGVRTHPSGWVDLELSGRAATLAAEAELTNFAVSLTHDDGLAAAVVIASGGGEDERRHG